MLGFYARADASKPIRTDLDNELIGQSILPDTVLGQRLPD
jgi:hypothetical protein